MLGFRQQLLGDSVGTGAVTHDHARIWVRAERPGSYRLHYWLAEHPVGERVIPFVVAKHAPDGTAVIDVATGLEPMARYAYRVESASGGTALGGGAFLTAPAPGQRPPDRFSFAVFSCHNPFDDHGNVDPARLAVLDRSASVLANERCARILWVGDQMYSDYPRSRSLFDEAYFATISPGPRTILDCTRSQVRALYYERYRLFWSFESLQRLQADWSGHFIWDDHEIVDNFGCAPEHRSERWRNLREGAADAFFTYQGCRVLPPSRRSSTAFHHSFRYGPVATFMMDLRSQKRREADGAISFYDRSQLRDLSTFLAANDDASVAVIVLTVPILHLPGWLATAGATLTGGSSDAADRWSNADAQASRNRLLRTIRAHQRQIPRRKIVLVGGDIHVGAVSQIEWSDDTASVLQLTSSAITHKDLYVIEKIAEVTPRLPHSMDLGDGLTAGTRLLAGQGAASANPYGGANFGTLEVETSGAEVAIHCRLFGELDGAVKPVYSSAIL